MAKSSASWQPGQSGNPGGRPKAIAEVRALAQQYTEKAILRLVGILDSDTSTDAAVVSAAGAILDRAVGRPEQSITQSTTLRDERPASDYKPDLAKIMGLLKKQNSDKKQENGEADDLSSSPARAGSCEADSNPRAKGERR